MSTSTKNTNTLDSSKSPTDDLALWKPVINVLFTRGLGPVSTFLLMLLLARMLGADASGAFYLSITLMTLMSILAKFGFDTALQRFAGAAAQQDNWSKVRGIYRNAMIVSILLSLVIAAVLFYLAPMTAANFLKNPEYSDLAMIMSIAIIPFTWLGIQAAMLKAVGKPAWGGFIEVAALPFITILLVVIISSIDLVSALSITICYLIGATITAVLGTWVVRRCLPKKNGTYVADTSTLIASCIPLTLIELMNYGLLWTPFLFLGALSNPAEAGSYNVAYRLSAQLGLLLIVFSSITAPRFAALYEKHDTVSLMHLAQRTTRMLAIIGVLPILFFILFPEFILAWFGDEFTAASTALVILAIGQLFNLATGPVGYLLAMTGNEKVLRNILMTTTIVTLVLSAGLIPTHGINGAAWAVSISMMFHNLVCCLQVQKRLNFPFLLLLAPSAR